MRIEPLARACVLAATLAFAACGGDPAPPASPTSAPTEAPTEAPTTADPAATAPPPAGDGSSPAINSVTVDPGDGTIMVGSGPALFRLAPGAKEAERLTGQLPGGRVSGNLVVRFAGPDDLLASGHPQDGELPENLGLIRSKDHGATWERVQGPEADYHELEMAGKLILGVNAESPDIQVSSDGGATWEKRTPPAAPIDVVVNPGDPQQWAVSTEQGTFVSTNAGQSWRPRDTTFGARLIWPSKDALYSVDRNGKVRASTDGGRTWQDRGDIGGLPSEVTAGRQGEILAAVVGGKIRRSKDGGRTWSTLTTLH
ncbi:hypothetical protein OM076_12300 [Solirubrobacter ginsenosidimutans]|uniref:Exo-alpha-sialidase n=1 Tax=Solirubrobacter ginsenosidimutans TaxID=490573 RepID=A0A9X3MSH1_9ACTN|nr:hypothetical protein [Solirubrobacter ginsenosidimutans]MDA0161051.1 hypothetical protein [Solirubrobacter ginsenosidimutans]